MPIQMTDTEMSSTLTSATAVYQPDADSGTWAVSWLPGRLLTRNQAITAMTLADVLGQDVPADSGLWPHIGGWAGELGLSTAEALQLLAEAALGEEGTTDD